MSVADERRWHALNAPPTPPEAPDGQLDLFAEVDEATERNHRLWNELDEWIEANAETWGAITYRARELHRLGHKFGANALLYWARIEFVINYTDGAQFALNNNFAPVVARRLIAEHPELEGTIVTRFSRVDEADGLTPYSEKRAG